MPRHGFYGRDQAFQKDLQNLFQKTMDQERKKIAERKGFKFSEHDRDWKHANFNYGSAEKRRKAQEAMEQAAEYNKKLLEKKVAEKMKPLQEELERLHFGEQGRQHAYEQMLREEKINAFKERQKRSLAKEKEQQMQVIQDKGSARDTIAGQKGRASRVQDTKKKIEPGKAFNDRSKPTRKQKRHVQKKKFEKKHGVQPSNNNNAGIQKDFNHMSEDKEAFKNGTHTRSVEESKSDQMDFKSKVRAEFKRRSQEKDHGIDR